MHIKNNRLNTGYGFTLVELLIVVAILGSLAAIVVPTFEDYTIKAKESAAKDNLRILRNTIEVYAAEHNGIAPGYLSGVANPAFAFFTSQMYYCTNVNGNVNGSETANGEFIYGPYLKQFPPNPFNDSRNFLVLADSDSLPESATGDYGWIYKPATKQIRLDWPGEDEDGKLYYEY